LLYTLSRRSDFRSLELSPGELNERRICQR
jgi:hypothetical protein